MKRTLGGSDPLRRRADAVREDAISSGPDTAGASPVSTSRVTSGTYDCEMTGSPARKSAESITIELTTEQIHRLDDLRSERNLSRAELIGELVDSAKPHRLRRRRDNSGRQKANPWAQVWPGGKA